MIVTTIFKGAGNKERQIYNPIKSTNYYRVFPEVAGKINKLINFNIYKLLSLWLCGIGLPSNVRIGMNIINLGE